DNASCRSANGPRRNIAKAYFRLVVCRKKEITAVDYYFTSFDPSAWLQPFYHWLTHFRQYLEVGRWSLNRYDTLSIPACL
ncbi:MAG TPA: hypothetical protein VEZ90_00775, partial [Blastocatellia bacterium]|nr:hypothetical protein [Blastocatellia bacterium]